MSAPIRKILIVGGGTAGWMAAAALNVAMRGSVAIELIESDEIGTVGVGEATLPTIREFNHNINLDEAEFLKATQGTFKLGIEFPDWREPGTRFFHGFGDYVVNDGPFSTLNHWLIARDALGEGAGTLDEYHMAAAMAASGRFAPPVDDPRSPLFYFSYAYHFDAGLYARLLRSRSEANGVVRHEGRIAQTHFKEASGFIDAVELSDGRRLTADLFVDCSGFVSLLMGKAMDVPFLDYSHWLPVDRAWAVPCRGVGPLLPFTRATAREAGWQWRIPLQHRVGNGYVFSSAHISEDEARARLMGSLEGEALAEPRLLRFRTGRRESFWTRNCVAIGLSSGFIEPLESTSISLIQNGISRLINLLPDTAFAPALACEYNRVQALEFDRIRDFIVLHYAGSQRDDTSFWRDIRAMSLPDDLRYKIETFRETGVVALLNEESFVTPSWQAILCGLGIVPKRRDALLSAMPQGEVLEAMRLRRGSLKAAAERLPTMDAFIDRFCKALPA
jgi:tryptophan halogenase